MSKENDDSLIELVRCASKEKVNFSLENLHTGFNHIEQCARKLDKKILAFSCLMFSIFTLGAYAYFNINHSVLLWRELFLYMMVVTGVSLIFICSRLLPNITIGSNYIHLRYIVRDKIETLEEVKEEFCVGFMRILDLNLKVHHDKCANFKKLIKWSLYGLCVCFAWLVILDFCRI